ncbi:uncharacterized protein CLUP02_01261 [Colletotrichum lupini]|uniref:Uncharacterized protein n=1 Tax=Colletotrichum lupini TaxID=145971 RepID=A0A9Q8SCD7_9PEZI|nr:uncharacterized protein CLUP02_01261 [Colletotrichum lupini]KAK1702866.1 hypothetical protein BDP67DRAFT_537095 [Colletotrichum lupini]UQC74610.1 hypothetical protein CLUP02_01261 [Colletotrichum lupini]
MPLPSVPVSFSPFWLQSVLVLIHAFSSLRSVSTMKAGQIKRTTWALVLTTERKPNALSRAKITPAPARDTKASPAITCQSPSSHNNVSHDNSSQSSTSVSDSPSLFWFLRAHEEVPAVDMFNIFFSPFEGSCKTPSIRRICRNGHRCRGK